MTALLAGRSTADPVATTLGGDPAVSFTQETTKNGAIDSSYRLIGTMHNGHAFVVSWE